MSSIGASKGVLEIAKFALYVSVPIGLMYTFAFNTKNIQKIMGNVSNLIFALISVSNNLRIKVLFKLIRIILDSIESPKLSSLGQGDGRKYRVLWISRFRSFSFTNAVNRKNL